MNYFKLPVIAILLCLGTLSLQQVANAELAIEEIVSQFNELNRGRGARFTFSTANTQIINNYYIGEHMLAKASDGDFVPSSLLGAYKSGTTSGSNYFNTFCVELDETITTTTYYGQLSYDPTSGQSVSTSGKVLSLGAAYLYQQFAAGTLQGFNYDNNRVVSAVALQNAIHFLTHQTPLTPTAWTGASANTFLTYLLSVNESEDYWMSDYNLNHTYTDLGKDFANSAVFMLMVGADKDKIQDQLFVAKVDRPDTDVPEPATIILWLGGLSALGFGVKKRRKTTPPV